MAWTTVVDVQVSRALAVNKEEALARQEALLLRSLPVNWAGTLA